MRPTTRLALAAFAAAATLAALPASGNEFNFTTTVAVPNTLFNTGVSLDIDSEGNIHFAYETRDHTLPFESAQNSREIWYATNASGEWVRTRITDDSTFDSFPVLRVDSNDNVHIAWTSGPYNGVQSIRYVNNALEPFQTNGHMPHITDPGLTRGFESPRFVIDPVGDVHMVFRSQPVSGGASNIHYTQYSPSYGAIPDIRREIHRISPSGSSQAYADIARTSDGTLHITWADNAGSSTSSLIAYRRGMPYSFAVASSGVEPYADLYPPMIAAAPDDTLTLVWRRDRVLRFIRTDATGNFDGFTQYFVSPNNLPYNTDRFAIDEDGRHFFAFPANQIPRGVFFVAEPEGGFVPLINPPFFDLIENTVPELEPNTIRNEYASIAVRNGLTAIAWVKTGPVNGVNQSTVYVSVSQKDTTPECPADFDGDGTVNTADITAFLSAWFAARAGGPANGADFDNDGTVNTADITAFLSAWFTARAEGC